VAVIRFCSFHSFPRQIPKGKRRQDRVGELHRRRPHLTQLHRPSPPDRPPRHSPPFRFPRRTPLPGWCQRCSLGRRRRRGLRERRYTCIKAAGGAGAGFGSFGAGWVGGGCGSVFVVVFVFVAQKHVSAQSVTATMQNYIGAQKSPHLLGFNQQIRALKWLRRQDSNLRPIG